MSHLVRKGYLVFDTPCKGCKSLDNVTIQIDIACVFRIMGNADKNEDPNLVRKFVHEVSPRGLQQQLTDAIDEACRMLARSMKHREVYGLRNLTVRGSTVEYVVDDGGHFETDEVGVEMASTDQSSTLLVGEHDAGDETQASRAVFKGEGATARMIKLLNRQFQPQGVQITDVMITDVQLPTEIVQQMTNKTLVISSNAQEIMTQQFEMQDLNFSEDLKLMTQSFEEDRLKEKQDGEQKRNEVAVNLKSMKAQEDKKLRLMVEENQVLLQSIDAEADLEVTMLVQERNRITSELAAQSKAKAAAIQAEADLYCVEKLSEAKLEVERNDAKAMEITADAEGTIAPLLKEYNIHETNLRKLKVFSSLSSNDHMLITPSDNKDVQTMLLCDEILSSRASTGSVTRAEMLSELMLMKAGGQVAMNTSSGATVLATR